MMVMVECVMHTCGSIFNLCNFLPFPLHEPVRNSLRSEFLVSSRAVLLTLFFMWMSTPHSNRSYGEGEEERGREGGVGGVDKLI